MVRLHQGHAEDAKALCQRSIETGRTLGDHSLTAMGLNTYGGILFEEGQLDVAKAMFEDAQLMAATDQVLAAKIEQNLGIIANVQGMWSLARSHYEQSLEAFERLGDERGAAVAHQNLGMISADREEWDSAKGHYNEALRMARQTGEVRLEGLCRLNHAEALLAGQLFGQAQEDAEAASALFHRIGSVLDEADGCRVLGLVFTTSAGRRWRRPTSPRRSPWRFRPNRRSAKPRRAATSASSATKPTAIARRSPG